MKLSEIVKSPQTRTNWASIGCFSSFTYEECDLPLFCTLIDRVPKF
jgi:hypothetical protein